MITKQQQKEFDTKVKSNLDAWQQDNFEVLRPLHWLSQRGYRLDIFNSTAYDIGVDALEDMPERLTVAYARPKGRNRFPDLAGLFPGLRLTAASYGRWIIDGTVPSRQYIRPTYRITLRPVNTLWWGSLAVPRKDFDFLFALALLDHHALSYTLFDEAAKLQYDVTGSAANAVYSNTLDLCSWRNTSNITEGARAFLDTTVMALLRAQPTHERSPLQGWKVGSRLDAFLNTGLAIVDGSNLFSQKIVRAGSLR